MPQTYRFHVLAFAALLALGLAGCGNPYDPGQRALGGAGIGVAGGALIGGVAGGGRGALAGALLGGAGGAVLGAATTPNPPPRGYYRRRAPAYGYGYGY